MMRRFVAIAWALAAAQLGSLVAPPAAWAGGFSNLDFGVRRVGMMAVMAKPDDGAAIYHNPAGLTLGEGTRLYHSQTWNYIDLGVRMYDSEGVLRPDENMTPTWNVGVVPLLGVASDLGTEDWQVGLGLYAPNAYGAKLDDTDPLRYHATDALFLASQLTGAVAWDASDRLTVAGGASLLHVYLTGARIMSPLVLQDPDRRFDSVEESEPFDNKLELAGTDLTWSAQLGVLLKLTDTLSFGAAFVRGAGLELEGDVTLTQPDGVKQVTSQTTTMVIPSSVRAGLNWEISADTEVGLDLSYWHYQVYQEQRTTLGEPLMGFEELISPKNYGNSWNYSVGLLHRVKPSVEVMLGFHQDFSPIPEETFAVDTPTEDLIGFSAGARWQATERLKLGLGGIRNWYDLFDIQGSKTDPPTNIKAFGGITGLAFDVSWTL